MCPTELKVYKVNKCVESLAKTCQKILARPTTLQLDLEKISKALNGPISTKVVFNLLQEFHPTCEMSARSSQDLQGYLHLVSNVYPE